MLAASLLIYFAVTRDLRNNTDFGIQITRNHYALINRVWLATFFAAIPFWFISGFRYFVGTDYLTTYYTGFYRILDGMHVDNFEPGYLLLNKLIQAFTNNVYWLFIITALIFTFFTFYAIYCLSTDIPYSIVLLFVSRYFFISMNGVRQLIAISILCFSIKYVIHRDLKRFILCVAIAMTFHATSALFLVVYLVKDIRIQPKRLLLVFAIELISLKFVLSIVLRLLAGTKYGALISRYRVCGIKFTVFTIVFNLFILAVGYAPYKENIEDDKFRIALNLQIISVMVTFALRTIPLMERVYWIFNFPSIICICIMTSAIKNTTKRKFIKGCVAAILAVYMFYDICILKDHSALPYQFIFGHAAEHNSGLQWY